MAITSYFWSNFYNLFTTVFNLMNSTIIWFFHDLSTQICYSKTNSHLCKYIDIKVAEFLSNDTAKCNNVDVITLHQHTISISLQYLENLYFKLTA